MVVFMWKQYTARVRGAVVKPVTCGECGTEYVYLVERQASGQGTSPYYLDNKGAARRADEAAQRALRKALAEGVEVAPCPKCGHVQLDMARLARKRRLRWLSKTGWIVTVVWGILGFLNAVSQTGMDEPYLLSWPTYLWLAAIGPALVALRYGLVRSHDPNDTHVEERLALAAKLSLTREEYERQVREEGGKAT